MDIEPAEFTGTKRYAVRRRIGGGATGLVYECYDRDRDVVVALKTLRQLGEHNIYRLKREFRTLADLTHPNLVSLYELEGSEDTWFVTMELIEGENFLTWVRGRRPKSVAGTDEWSLATDTWLSDVTDITEDVPETEEVEALIAPDLDRLRSGFVQLLSGVAALHGAGKLHRDLKPSNVLVTAENRVVLLDFGLVYETDRSTSEASHVDKLVGTAAFMAPETAVGAPTPDPSADLYSVGVLLYAALIGRLPFQGTMSQILQQKASREPLSPRTLLDAVPPELDALCMACLSRDPTARPTAVQALQTLGMDPADLSQYASAARANPVEGREAQRQVLEDAWQVARRGRCVLVQVSGQPGMGKTALVRHFVNELKKREEITALSGRCYERESLPFKAIDAVMDAVRRRLDRMNEVERGEVIPAGLSALSRVFPGFGAFARTPAAGAPAETGEDRHRAFEAAAELFAALARKRPLVVFIDDAQWGDLDSARMLSALLAALRHAPCLWILAYRDTDIEASEFLTSFLKDSGVERADRFQVALAELNETAAGMVARGLLGNSHPEPLRVAEWMARETAGNPFLMAELAKYVALQVERGNTDLATYRLDQLFAVEDLPRDARRMLVAVALAARPLPVKLIGRAAELDDPLPAVTLLRARHYVRTNRGPLGDVVELYHSRIGETVQRTTPPTLQAEVHLKLADAMEGTGYYDPEAMMLHRLNGGEIDRAAELAKEAAHQAERNLAWDRAARLYRTALSLREWPADETHRMRHRLAESLVGAGRGEDAATLLLELAAGAEPAERARLHGLAAQQLLCNGHLDQAMGHLDHVLSESGLQLVRSHRRTLMFLIGERACIRWGRYRFVPRPESEIPPKMLRRVDTCNFVANAHLLIDPMQGAHFHCLDLLYALQSGEKFRITRALCREMMLVTGERAFIDLKRLARELVDEVGKAHTNGLFALGEGMHQYLLGRFKTAYRLCRQAERIFEEHGTGHVFEASAAQVFALRSLMFQGELKQVAELLPLAASRAEDRRDHLQLAWIRGDVFSTLSLATEDLDSVRSDVSWTLSRFAPQGWNGPVTYMHLFALRANLQLLLYEGRGAEAWQEQEHRFPAARGSGFDRQPFTRTYLHDMRARCALAAIPSNAAARRAAKHSIGVLKGLELKWSTALALLHEAALLRIDRDKPGAVALLRKALPAFERADLPLYAAVTRRHLGALLKGDEGKALIAGADGWMYNQAVASPARLAHMLAPGFDRDYW